MLSLSLSLLPREGNAGPNFDLTGRNVHLCCKAFPDIQEVCRKTIYL